MTMVHYALLCLSETARYPDATPQKAKNGSPWHASRRRFLLSWAYSVSPKLSFAHNDNKKAGIYLFIYLHTYIAWRGIIVGRGTCIKCVDCKHKVKHNNSRSNTKRLLEVTLNLLKKTALTMPFQQCHLAGYSNLQWTAGKKGIWKHQFCCEINKFFLNSLLSDT